MHKHLSRRRLRLANVSREMQQWSVENGDYIWSCVELHFRGGSPADPVTWAGAKWLLRHVSYIHELTLLFHRVRFAAAQNARLLLCAAAVLPCISESRTEAECAPSDGSIRTEALE